MAFFLEAEKAFNTVWHDALFVENFQFGLPTKVTRSLSGFFLWRVI